MVYRVTRNAPYSAPGCPGHLDTRARQGYYVTSGNARAAMALARERHGIGAAEPVTVQAWEGAPRAYALPDACWRADNVVFMEDGTARWADDKV
jgi:hypothetical protein